MQERQIKGRETENRAVMGWNKNKGTQEEIMQHEILPTTTTTRRALSEPGLVWSGEVTVCVCVQDLREYEIRSSFLSFFFFLPGGFFLPPFFFSFSRVVYVRCLAVLRILGRGLYLPAYLASCVRPRGSSSAFGLVGSLTLW